MRAVFLSSVAIMVSVVLLDATSVGLEPQWVDRSLKADPWPSYGPLFSPGIKWAPAPLHPPEACDAVASEILGEVPIGRCLA